VLRDEERVERCDVYMRVRDHVKTVTKYKFHKRTCLQHCLFSSGLSYTYHFYTVAVRYLVREHRAVVSSLWNQSHAFLVGYVYNRECIFVETEAYFSTFVTASQQNGTMPIRRWLVSIKDIWSLLNPRTLLIKMSRQHNTNGIGPKRVTN
jgi:hypothetical protein